MWLCAPDKNVLSGVHLQKFVMILLGNGAGAYDKAIESAIRNSGFKPMRIDQKKHIDKIDNQIIAEIRHSGFLMADFTAEMIEQKDGKSIYEPHGGVYYEAGFA